MTIDEAKAAADNARNRAIELLIDAACRAYRANDSVGATRAAERLRMRGLRYHDILGIIAERLGTTQAKIMPTWDALIDEGDDD